MNLGGADGLDRALAQTEDSRSDKVAQAKELIQQGSYPPEVLVRKISALLAIHIQAQDNAS